MVIKIVPINPARFSVPSSVSSYPWGIKNPVLFDVGAIGGSYAPQIDFNREVT